MADASLSRVLPEAGWADPSKLERGPSGRTLCRRCKTECPKGRRTFCSDACIHEWKVRSQPGYAARCVLERDHGVCASCGLDCVALAHELRDLRAVDRFKRFPQRCNELGLPNGLRHLARRLWEMDHITPVIEGGGSCGLENLRTLCWACHARATKALAGRRARARCPQLSLPLGANRDG